MRLKSRSARVSPAVLVLVLAALAVGAAASLLASAPRTTTPGSTHYAELVFPLWEIEAAMVVLIFGGIGLMLFFQLQSGSSPVPGRIAVTAVVSLLIAILLLLVFQYVVFGNGLTGSGGNSHPTSNPTPGSGSNTSSNSTLIGGSGSFFWLGPSVPPWTLFAIVAGVGVLVSVLVTSPIWRRALADWRQSEPGLPSPAAMAAIRDAVTDASAALEAGGDLRTIVIRFYAAILEKVGPSISDVDGATPEEIRASHLVRLGIRPGAAEVLTRSFEEARYSSHLVTAATVARVTAALRDASEDLERAA
jgi:hypothetical protein